MKLSLYSWIFLAIKDTFTADTRTQTNQIDYFSHHKRLNTENLSEVLDLPPRGNYLDIKVLFSSYVTVFKRISERHKDEFMQNLDFKNLKIQTRKQIQKMIHVCNTNIYIFLNFTGFYNKLTYTLKIYRCFTDLFCGIDVLSIYNEIESHLIQVKRPGAFKDIVSTNEILLYIANKINIIYKSYIISYNEFANVFKEDSSNPSIVLFQLENLLDRGCYKEIMNLVDTVKNMHGIMDKIIKTSLKIIKISEDMLIEKESKICVMLIPEDEVEKFIGYCEHLLGCYLSKLRDKRVYIEHFAHVLADFKSIIKYNQFNFYGTKEFFKQNNDFNLLNIVLCSYFDLLYTVQLNYRIILGELEVYLEGKVDIKLIAAKRLKRENSIRKIRKFHLQKLYEFSKFKYECTFLKRLSFEIQSEIAKYLIYLKDVFKWEEMIK